MTDFTRIKWLNVDGQQVPFTEPQHFTGNGDETVRTGKDNPLPVANYTKKGNIWLPVSEKNPVPTQVTGSNVEEITVLPRAIRTDNAYASSNTVEVSADAKVAILELRVYGGIGNFSDGEGYRLQVMRQTTGRVQQDYIAQCRFSSHFGSNKTGNLINISPTFFEKEDDERRILDVQSTFYPSFRPMLSISGTFGAGEGIDCELKVYIVY